MSKAEQLTDEQWAILEPLIPKRAQREDGCGRPETHSDREVLNGILWVLRTGAAWGDLSDRFRSSSTCFRRFSRWAKAGVLRKIFEALARDLEERGGIDLSECFIDGTFTVAKDQAGQGYEAHGYCRRCCAAVDGQAGHMIAAVAFCFLLPAAARQSTRRRRLPSSCGTWSAAE